MITTNKIVKILLLTFLHETVRESDTKDSVIVSCWGNTDEYAKGLWCL